MHILWDIGYNLYIRIRGFYLQSRQMPYHRVSWSLEAVTLGIKNCITLKFVRHLSSTVAGMLVKFQSDWITLNPRFIASEHHKINSKMPHGSVNRSPGTWNIVAGRVLTSLRGRQADKLMDIQMNVAGHDNALRPNLASNVMLIAIVLEKIVSGKKEAQHDILYNEGLLSAATYWHECSSCTDIPGMQITLWPLDQRASIFCTKFWIHFVNQFWLFW